MVKYVKEDTQVVFSEIPDEITLAINISNCPHHCKGCHSPYLRENIGDELTEEALDLLIKKNDDITCICFMGEGNDMKGLVNLAQYVKTKYGGKYKMGLYYGGVEIDFEPYVMGSLIPFDYVKVGPYKEEYGPLNKKTTNQRLYQIEMQKDKQMWNDITNKFWK